MTIVLIVICVGVAMFFLGLLFGSMLRDGELREHSSKVTRYEEENRRLRERCRQMEIQAQVSPIQYPFEGF